MSTATHRYPALHNAMWPGLVGKGPDSEPPIDLETMLDLTAAAEVDGVRFDGVDLFLFAPHVDIDSTDDDLKRLGGTHCFTELVVGSVVAPVWPPTGGGSAMGSEDEPEEFPDAGSEGLWRSPKSFASLAFGATESCASIPLRVRRIGRKIQRRTPRRIAETFREACAIAEGYGERLAAEGEICWGGMHSWKRMVELLEMVGRPETLGFQADMAHTLLFTLGYNAPEDRILPENFDWSDQEVLDDAIRTR